MNDGTHGSVQDRRSEILHRSTGIDFESFSRGVLAFDYDGLLSSTGYTLDEVREIQQASGVGDTPLLELHQLTAIVRSLSPPGQGARVFIKDEAANLSGSFKDRRASVSAHHAQQLGYQGLVAATSGNFGAAIAAQGARRGLATVIVQELFDSQGRGQPEILEKRRKCEALGAEVLQTTVGPELFDVLLQVLDETGYFNASLYTPFSIAGIETLGWEIADETRRVTGRYPAQVLATHAGGGMVTGTARGLRAHGAVETEVVGVSVDLSGLHMASDTDFNRKSFTTGHTGFSVPFTSWPDRVDVTRNAARPLRYLDRFVTVTQGEAMYATELLARVEGIERGPAGNTSLAAAMVLAQHLPQDEVIVISETEYTGAGKSPVAQLSFAEGMGVQVVRGGRDLDRPGHTIALPQHPRQLGVTEVELSRLRTSYLRRARQLVTEDWTAADEAFLEEDSRVRR